MDVAYKNAIKQVIKTRMVNISKALVFINEVYLKPVCPKYTFLM